MYSKNYSTFASSDNGASAPNPDLLFVLIQKVSKKIKTSPASLEKSTFGRLKSSKLVEVRPIDCNFKSAHYELQLQTRTIFNRLPLLFFGSPSEVARLGSVAINQKYIVPTNEKSIKVIIIVLESGQLLIK